MLMLPVIGAAVTGDATGVLTSLDVTIHEVVSHRFSAAEHIDADRFSNYLDSAAKSFAVALSTLFAAAQLRKASAFPFVKVAKKESLILALAAPAGLQATKLLASACKASFHRIRPSELLPDFSYPSAHTSRFVFCAVFVACVLLPRLLKKPGTPEWLGTAALAWLIMGSTRVLADVHWLSDAAGGALLGLGMASATKLLLLGLARAGGSSGGEPDQEA
eukprot:TRINITY_DN77184_c0_g1_i1.p1 TRINITY_DN77184_c0_g1~~TRINITY_DN77184_c0_g1_i1.p1  ORF type:complete len:219 (-),score=49.20 TRINITY_DN77184_c0_g1_i1:31-687(-)